MASRRNPESHASISLLLLVAALLVAVVVSVLADERGEAGAAPAGVESAAGPAASPTLDPIHAAPPASEAIERDRIASHLAEVEAELRARPVDHLDAEQRGNRARHIEVLAEYRERGEFPRNLDFPGELVPYFVDDRGVHCAVGYLIHREGRDDIVRRIAAARNNATIAELAGDAELLAWLDEAGLTPAEAARIQPMYCAPGTECCGMYPCPVTEPEPDGRVTGRYAAASLAAGAMGGMAIGLSLAGERGSESRWLGGVSAAAGMAGLGLGMHGLAEGGDARAVGGVNVALGLLGTWVGMRSLVRGPATPRPPFEEDEEDREGDTARAAASRVTVSPLLPMVGGGGRAGLAVRVRH